MLTAAAVSDVEKRTMLRQSWCPYHKMQPQSLWSEMVLCLLSLTAALVLALILSGIAPKQV